MKQRIEIFDEGKDTILPLKDFFQSAEEYCSQFRSIKVKKEHTLVDRIKTGNEDMLSLREKARDFKNIKRSYQSLNSEKELKKTLRNDHYRSMQFQQGPFGQAGA